MKRIALLFVLVFPVICISQEVSEQMAARLARNFLYEKTESLQGRNFNPEHPASIFPTTYRDTVLYYTVVFPGEAYAVVAADTRCLPVLAWSDAPLTWVGDIPENAREWFDWYGEQVLEVKRHRHATSQGIASAWSRYLDLAFVPDKEKTEGVEPLTTSRWGQKYYYNNSCPPDPDGPGGHAIAGCVATAMAQVLYYYRHPQQGEGSNGYMSDYGYEYVDFEEAHYLWDEMVNEVYGKLNPEITKLIYHTGVAVEMNYGPGNSGALTVDAVEALKNHFRYNSDMNFISIYDPDLNFRDSLIASLQKNRVILYRGGGIGGGHAFVCDGFSDSTHFHFNWGWTGNYNGYYTIENLNPNVYDFTFDQQAAINIYPREDYPSYCQGMTVLNASRGTFEDGSGPEHSIPGTSCSWLITPGEAGITNIRLWFPRFETIAGQDIVSVYDGSTTSDPLLGQFSGEDLPPYVTSSGAEMLVVFETGSADGSNGWHAEYLGYSGPFCNDESLLEKMNENYFTDGSGPYDYIENSDCSWLLKPQSEGVDSVGSINFYLHWLELGLGDTLYIHDGADNGAPVLAKLQGDQIPDTIHSSSNNLYLRFVSSDAQCGDGWAAGYTSNLPVYCDDTSYHTAKTGILEDGSGSYKYVPNTNCFWLIETENTIVTTFEFLEFDLEYGYDQVRFYNAEFFPPVLYATYWGHDLPALLEMNTSKVLIEFRTDESTEYDGWKIKYAALAPGIDEPLETSTIGFYPQPADARITIHGLYHDTRVILYDIHQRVLLEDFHATGSGDSMILDIRKLTPGLYFIAFELDSVHVVRKLLVH